MTTFAPLALTRVRNELCQKWREFLLDGYAVEVATPILQPRPDIAPVHQFTTQHPTTGDLAYLRIAPTEYLKRLMAAGQERVFEFAVNFRDDVADETHLPEFTSLEVMARDVTCVSMERTAVSLCELAVEVARRVEPVGLPKWVQDWEQRQVRRIELAEELAERFGTWPTWIDKPSMVARLLDGLGETADPSGRLPVLLDQLVNAIAQRYNGAVLICGFPEHLGGPAAPHPTHLGFKQRSELFIDGLEVANMSSNLIDGQALRQWHLSGVEVKNNLGISTNRLDTDLLDALDGNLPPSAVLGIGVERMLQATLNLPDIRILR